MGQILMIVSAFLAVAAAMHDARGAAFGFALLTLTLGWQMFRECAVTAGAIRRGDRGSDAIGRGFRRQGSDRSCGQRQDDRKTRRLLHDNSPFERGGPLGFETLGGQAVFD